MEVFNGSAGDEAQATLLHGGLQAPGRGPGGQRWAYAQAVANEIGLHPTLLCRWVRQYGTDAGKAEAPRPAAAPFFKPVPVPTADQAAEIARLRRECDRLRMERDILKKSISIFAGPLK